MRLIYHMAPRVEWSHAATGTHYAAASLPTEGFIHCTAEPEWLLTVANRFYRTEPGEFIIACIAVDAVDAEVRWEEADGHRFPHIYGPLNLDAVVAMRMFPRRADGTFLDPGL